MNTGLYILRQVGPNIDPNIVRNLRAEGLLFEHEDGTAWVDNDHPWDDVTANALVRNAGGFIIADEFGGRLAGPYRDPAKAEAARASAKVKFAPVIEGIEDDEAAASEGGGGAMPAYLG